MKPTLFLTVISLAAISLILPSCDGKEERLEARNNKGFRLPKGDADRGRDTFVQLKCHQCHSVEGVILPSIEEKTGVRFALGGEVNKVKSYGELVTAIIQPQHIVSTDYLLSLKDAGTEGYKSPMPEYNNTMTVQQMTDLVMFLHAHYKKHVPAYDERVFHYY